MSKKVTPYKDSKLKKKEQVKQMFDNISGNYDGLNRLISGGMDVKWRKKVVQLVADTQPKTILDIATGTGDLAISFSKLDIDNITGFDLSEGMLSVARKKAAAKNLNDKLSFIQGDSEAMPFDNDSFDAITGAFGIRNFETLEKG